jgi:hypothetical protein
MPPITFVTLCMGRLAHLKETLPLMARQRDSACVLVDWSCPEQCGDWAQANCPGVRVHRVLGQTTISVTAARNAGADLVESPWICFIDCDIVLHGDFSTLVTPHLRPGYYYRPHPVGTGLAGTWIVGTADVRRLGGYDDVLRCYGEDDYDVFDGLRYLGMRQSYYPSELLQHLPHDSAARTERFAFTDRRTGQMINRLYRVLKWEIVRQRGTLLERPERERLYEHCFQTVPRQWPQSPNGGYAADAILRLCLQELEAWLGRRPSDKAGPRMHQAVVEP